MSACDVFVESDPEQLRGVAGQQLSHVWAQEIGAENQVAIRSPTWDNPSRKADLSIVRC
jgi:hypothetical protein